jgi:mannose-6-phosphate isomerase-like protein (cupin superfamily)
MKELPVNVLQCGFQRRDKWAYAIVESAAEPGFRPPMHLHRNEEEHFAVLAGTYRILIEDRVLDAPVVTSVTVPRGSRHSLRYISNETGRLLAILTPGASRNASRPYARALQIRCWGSLRIMAVSSLGHRSTSRSFRPYQLLGSIDIYLKCESDESQPTGGPLLVRPYDEVNVSRNSAIVRLRQALTVLHLSGSPTL